MCVCMCVCLSVHQSVALAALAFVFNLTPSWASTSVIFCISNFSRAFHVFIAFISFASFLLFIYLCLYVAYTYLLTDRPPPLIPLGPSSFCLSLPCFASLRFRLVSFHPVPPAPRATYLRSKGWGVAQPRKAERNSNGNLKFFTIKMLLSCPSPCPPLSVRLTSLQFSVQFLFLA